MKLPGDERFDLVNQMKRASRSVPTNIAEGYGRRRSPKEFSRFLTIAMGSTNEMIVHLGITADLDEDLSNESAALQVEYHVVGEQLNRLIASWRDGAPVRAKNAELSTNESTTNNQRPTTG